MDSFAQQMGMRFQDLFCAQLPCFIVGLEPALFFEQMPQRNSAKKGAKNDTCRERKDMEKDTFFGALRATSAPTGRYIFQGFDAAQPYY